MKLIKRAASYPQVARIFVHPAIKKALCQRPPSRAEDRAWLGKVQTVVEPSLSFPRAARLPAGSWTAARIRRPVSGDDGCGQELANWYAMLKKAAIETAKPPQPGAKPWVGKPPLTMAQLPKECGTVLTAGGFEPPIPAAPRARRPRRCKAMRHQGRGSAGPHADAAQLKALVGSQDRARMPLPDRNPIR